MRTNRRAIQVDITDSDRLGMTFLMATIFHAIVILGVTFTLTPLPDIDSAPALDIILVQTKAPSEDENAQYLAQVSQQGGGDSTEKVRPKELFSAPTLADKPGLAKQMPPPQLAEEKSKKQLAMITQKESEQKIINHKNPDKENKKTTENKVKTQKSSLSARLAAEISNFIQLQASLKKTKYLNSSTREFIPAQYMREWINRVERVGNLNYPDQARRAKLSGTLILDVVIDASGKLIKTDLRQSSGHQLLDDAAIRIVQFAAPFPPFSKNLREQADIIHITRSWEFSSSNNRLTTK